MNMGSVLNQKFRFVRNRGSILLQTLGAMAVLMGMTSLSVDLGAYHTAKAELQRAADAAALAASSQIEVSGTLAATEARSYVEANAVGGCKLDPGAVTVQTGRWENEVFLPTSVGPLNAVSVTLRRTRATNNPVNLFFAKLVGVESIDVSATAIAYIKPKASPYNFVGVDSVKFTSLDVLNSVTGRVVSNGDINIGYPLGLLVGVVGDVRSYAGITKKGPLAAITGTTAPLSEKLVYPSVVLPATNNNDQIAAYLNASGDFTAVAAAYIPGGTYVVRDLNFVASLIVHLQGPVTFYVTRNANFAVTANLLGNTTFDPSNLAIRVCPGGAVNFIAPLLVPLRMDLYAPDTDITILVPVTNFKGRMIGKTLTIAVPLLSRFEEDQALGDPQPKMSRLTLVE